jgi:RNA polymerase sigma-70 factor, ECF subfamily
MPNATIAPQTMPPGEPQAALADLLQSVAQGDDSSLAELYSLLEGPIFSFAASRLGDRALAAEVLHEVMVEVWRRAGSFRGRSRPLTWVLGIAHHKTVDALRRRGRRAEEPPDGEAPDEALPSPAERLEREERRTKVRRALAALSEAHRQVVHLAFFEDLSYPEIARVLGIPTGTVKTRMFHAKKLLRRQLAPGLERGGGA